jgi:hypothetical protein
MAVSGYGKAAEPLGAAVFPDQLTRPEVNDAKNESDGVT